jgi:uncharacterized delta-60 repeat protein
VFTGVVRLVAVLFGALIVLSVGSAQAAPGELDPSFGRAGKVVTILGTTDDWVWLDDVALQSDGKIVASGGSGAFGSEDFTLVRYRTDGKLDESFGTGGTVTTSVATNDDEALKVALQPDGKIVAVGAGGDGSQGYGIVARYDPGGSLDKTFGSSGSVEARRGKNSFLRAVAVQADGKIVVVGTAFDPEQGEFRFVVGRYDAGGTLDRSFGSAGWASAGVDSSAATDVALQPDGKIVVAGSRVRAVEGDYEWGGFVLARYSSNGTLDPTFGSGGRVVTQVGAGGEADAIVLQPDGKIFVGGTTLAKSGESVDSTGKLALVRYEADGSLDPTFGRGGKATSGFGDLSYAEDVSLLAGGRIAVAVGNSLGLFEVARYLPNGGLDKAFGKGGFARVSFGGQFDVATSVAVQPDGMLIGAGTTYNSAKEEQRFALARLIDAQTICHVPKLKGRGLSEARAAVARGHCSMGRVRWIFSKATRGRVISQTPLAGTHMVAGGKVGLLVSNGAR